MSQVSKKLEDLMTEKNWDAGQTARELRVGRASLYNYLAKKSVPDMDVLQRAHQKWGWTFKYWNYDLDEKFFESLPNKKTRPLTESQIPLPFIEGLRNEDIEIIAVVPRKPNAVEVSLKIRFAMRR